jgi:hypothetical protein
MVVRKERKRLGTDTPTKVNDPRTKTANSSEWGKITKIVNADKHDNKSVASRNERSAVKSADAAGARFSNVQEHEYMKIPKAKQPKNRNWR